MGFSFEKVCVVGVGLIGGSMALGMRRERLAKKIIGVGRGEDNLKQALSLGIIDSYTFKIEEGVENADLVILATPVRAMPELVEKAKPYFRNGTILTDVGSTKLRLIQKISPTLSPEVDFVPAHPIAGREKTGARYSDPDIFKGRWTIITPCERSTKEGVEKIKSLWKSLGAKVEIMDAKIHDELLAWISHLPHIVVYALVGTLLDMERKAPLLRFSAGGFRDFIRIAGSSPEMWRDIFLENKEYVIATIRRYQKELEELAELIQKEDAKSLEEYFAKAREVKEKVQKDG